MARICDKGFLYDHEICQEAYSFVHLMNPPYFTHLDNSKPITLQIKEYSLDDVLVRTRQSICIENFVNWQIEIESMPVQNFSYGITILIDSTIPKDTQNEPLTRVSNYADVNAYRWKEQKQLKLPVVYAYINGKPVTICTDPKNEAQFFYFDELEKRYIKISHPSKIKRMNLYITSGHTNDYKALYPESKQYIEFSSVCFNKVKKYYGADVSTKQMKYKDEIFFLPQEKEIEPYAEILWNELRHYPSNIFRILRVKNLFLYSSQGRFNGFFDGDIYLNTSSGISVSQKIIAIHHEIFHAIERKLQKKHDEHLATVYGFLMHDQNYLEHSIAINPKIKDDIKEVIAMLSDIDESFVSLIKRKPQTDQFRNLDIAYKSREKVLGIASILEKQKIHEIPKFSAKHDTFMLVGIPGCGLALAKRIFNNYATENADPVVLVRNPLDICIRAYLKNHSNIFDTYARWEEYYTYKMNNGFPFIKYEDIVVMNKKPILKSLSLWNVEIPKSWMSEIDIDRIQYNCAGITGLELLLSEFVNTKVAWYYGYEMLSINI